MLDLDAIEARAEAATPGPWTARLRDDMWEINDGSGSNFVSIVESCWLPDDCDTGQYGGIPDVDDARFIAHARTDVPALVAELRAAREVVEAAHKWKSALTWDAEWSIRPAEVGSTLQRKSELLEALADYLESNRTT